MTSITLYHCADARSLRPLWTLEEMGLDYKLVNMAFPPRARHEGYLDINPLGTVPTFIDEGPDGKITMTESAGICQYLVDRFGPTDIGLSINDHQYGDYLNWLHRSDTTLTFPQTLVLRYSRLEPPERRVQQVVDDYSRWFMSRLRCVELALQGRKYLLGDRFTIADISVGYALFLGTTLGLDEGYKDNCRRYLADLMQRDGFKRAREKQKIAT